ncbi:MAG: methylmalonyl-CoA mutase family protein [Candidatus Freyarchaeota archaeon]|nr:methylmalonyl-CoA mutase family protein [Candidatus Jordarchaeia archaeon]MBS7268082.1 methylmalonyl-CoA mutase family protein [Candidatus Jordarchaeia archaeon]MBS7279087.1 methylmalonyl-CoA mutase family protein [Candidatus Jordarchaeia archaeon]
MTKIETFKKGESEYVERAEKFTTLSDIEVKPFYTPDDIQINYHKDLGLPGEFPFVRGVYQTMYRGRLWTMRMFSGYGTAFDTNKRFKYLLEHGETGLSVAFDFPTLYGYDSDHPLAHGEVGKCGVAISSLADMEVLFDGIPLNKVTTSMTINGPAAIIWAFYIAAAENQGAQRKELGGTIQNDILKEYIAQNSYIFPPEPSMRLILDTFEFGTEELPRWNTISISGYHIREAGATAVQELAFTLADGLTYVDAALERGMNIDAFAPRLSFFFNAHNYFFEEIAKYRAARRIWAKEMKNRGATNPRSMMLRFHTQTAGVSLTAQQPLNNVVRVAIQALAAVLGGTQSLHTNSYDEAYALPTEEAVKLALRTQQIIAYETGVTDSIDPLGGSYYVEWLTNKMEEETYKYFDIIEKKGGVIECIKKGFFQNEIAKASYKYQKEVEQGKRKIVGVNCYRTDQDDEVCIPVLVVDPEVERVQCERLKKLRETRNNDKVRDALKELEKQARTENNLMPYLLKCAHAYATLGEIRETLVSVFGEYQPKDWF